MAYWEPEGYYQLGEGEYAHITAEDVLCRMREVLGLSTLSELAGWLGVRLSLLTDAKRRNIVPLAWLRRFPDPIWTLTGQGTSHR